MAGKPQTSTSETSSSETSSLLDGVDTVALNAVVIEPGVGASGRDGADASEAARDGDPARKTCDVVVLHGLFGASTNWRTIARRLADQTRSRVHLLDLRNHGQSPWSERMDYLAMAADVRRYLRAVVERPVLVGHSMGGKVGMALALSEPDLLAQLVVVDIAPVRYANRFAPQLEAMQLADAMHRASRSEVQKRLSERLGDDRGVVAFLMQNLVSRNDHFDWRINLAAVAAWSMQISGFPEELLSQRWDGPTTFISGSRSDYVRDADHERIRGLFPKVHFRQVQAGHWVHAEAPDDFLACLIDSLSEAGAKA